MVTYQLGEQRSLTICLVVYVVDDNADIKISVLDFIEEPHGSETPFIIELDDYFYLAKSAFIRLRNNRYYEDK